jgi:hypothetical protein
VATVRKKRSRKRRRGARRSTVRAVHPTRLAVAEIPAGVSKAAADGLRLVDEGFGGAGLTEGALERARVLARGGSIPRETLRMMRNWFRRHQVDHRPGWDRDHTHGWVAWQLWGGHAGWRWAERLEGDPPWTIPAWAS